MVYRIPTSYLITKNFLRCFNDRENGVEGLDIVVTEIYADGYFINFEYVFYKTDEVLPKKIFLKYIWYIGYQPTIYQPKLSHPAFVRQRDRLQTHPTFGRQSEID